MQKDFNNKIFPARATASQQKLAALSSGSNILVQKFVAQLDVELEARGEAPVRMSAAALSFTPPERKSMRSSQPQSYQSGMYTGAQTQQETTTAASSGSSSTMLILLAGLVGAGMVAMAYSKGVAAAKTEAARAAADPTVDDSNYSSKIAGMDQIDKELC